MSPSRYIGWSIVCLLLVQLSAYAFAVEWEDLAEPETALPSPNSDTNQPYLPYPPMVQTQRAPEQPRPWYRRLLNPFIKQASPPILQPAKTPKESPKETLPLADPLIRLPMGIHTDAIKVPSGFYLLSLQLGASPSDTRLLLRRQQQTLLSLAVQQAVAPMTSADPLPPPPVKTDANAKSPPVSRTSAHAELAEDGQTMVLVFQDGSQHYVSIPLPVDMP